MAKKIGMVIVCNVCGQVCQVVRPGVLQCGCPGKEILIRDVPRLLESGELGIMPKEVDDTEVDTDKIPEA